MSSPASSASPDEAGEGFGELGGGHGCCPGAVPVMNRTLPPPAAGRQPTRRMPVQSEPELPRLSLGLLGGMVRLQLEMGQDPAEVRRRHGLSADQMAVIRAGEAIGAGAAGQADVQAPPEALCASTG